MSLEWGLEAEIDPIYTTGSILPNLRFKWVDASAGIWDIDSTDAINDIYSNSGETDNRTTKNISNNLFSIGQRQFYQESWNLIDQNGAMKYLKVKNLKLKRTAILKDFIKYDIYANVSGRVDNIAGTYTGTPQFTSEERQNYYEGRTRETGITAYKPIKAPIKAPIQQVKPKQVKPVIAKPLAITNLKIKKDSKY